jgi:antitoxin VapB
MALNIKKESTNQLIKHLAEITGETLTTAVHTAVEERIERIEGDRVAEKLERIHAISEDAAPRFRSKYADIDHGDLLYDENGLPK